METLTILEQNPLPFAQLLGVRLIDATPDRLRAEMTVREELCTRPAVMHGGAVMAFADTLGAYATMLNLTGGASTTTIESKTNFIAAAPVGTG
jgi:1,4-dihydroxy-2-naphthoyl-CoA hydrolase